MSDIVMTYFEQRRGHWISKNEIDQALRKQSLSIRPSVRCRSLAIAGKLEEDCGLYRLSNEQKTIR